MRRITLTGVAIALPGLALLLVFVAAYGQSTVGSSAAAAVSKGSKFTASRAAVINSLGRLDGASGTLTNCVLVNGSSAACGGELGYTAEDAANKSTNTSLGSSDTLYPSQLAVKTYVDATAELVANKSTNTSLGSSDTLYPSQLAVKTYVDAHTAAAIAHTTFRAISQNTVAGSNFSLPAANPPTQTSVEGANSGNVTQAATAANYGVLAFAENGSAATSQSVQGMMYLPSTADLAAGITARVKWRTSATSGDVLWQIQGMCVATLEVPGSFGTAASWTASTAPGTTLQWKDSAALSLTTADVLSGCAAGEVFLFRLFRDATNVGDTLAASADLVLADFGVTQ